MLWVHHVSEDAKALLAASGMVVPLLSAARHDCAAFSAPELCDVYEEQVTCADCHTQSP